MSTHPTLRTDRKEPLQTAHCQPTTPLALPQLDSALLSKADCCASTATMSAPKLRIVIVGHVDHGKSTLIGRLFHDTHSLPDGKVEAIRKASEAEGMEFEFAFLLDALLEEQEQNITIDTTQLPFRTAHREYVIIDAPGHKEFLKNMITGAASADAAVLMIDAVEGIQEQSRRHALLLSLLGVKQVAVVVNKMDLVAFDEVRFQHIRSEALKFLVPLGVEPQYVIPISAKKGHNIIHTSPNMPWYKGPSILEALDRFILPKPPFGQPLRFMVQDIYRFDHRRILAGRIEAGSLQVGEEIYFWPDGKRSRIRSIEEWNAQPTSAVAGKSVAITLEEQIFVERGQIASHEHEAPAVHREIVASLFWLHEEPLLLNKPFVLKLGAQSTEARLVEITHLLDSSTLQSVSGKPTQIAKNEVAEVLIRTKRSLAFDTHDRINETGRFVILTGKRIGGGGIVRIAQYPENPLGHLPASSHIVWSSSRVTRIARAEQYGHRGAILWFTGLSASGKSSLAAQLEWHLHRRGMATFILDGDNLRHGLSSDLKFSPADRKENIRRASEAAKLLAEAGLVVICSFISPYREDRRLVRESCAREGIAFAEVYVNAPVEVCEERDPKGLYKKARAGEIPNFTGITAPYEPPANPELELRTAEQSWEECMSLLCEFTEGFAARPHPDIPQDLNSGSGI